MLYGDWNKRSVKYLLCVMLLMALELYKYKVRLTNVDEMYLSIL